MKKILLTTSDTPREYYKECQKKKIKRCSKCGEVKDFSEFSTTSNKKYLNSHCKKCVASKRKTYVAKMKKKGDAFRKKKTLDSAKGRVSLRKSYIADNLTTSLNNYLNRMGIQSDYASIHKCITPELLEAKLASIKINRLINKTT